ncbi:ABC transporter substrate-binding protein [Acidithrix ferrooxidans]|uniref:D-ribose-binding periplasmic protein n=1 Tax=Acidithrix ferrooxidans TaxID=1280514 RepID=A0A0D8HHH3_9ACTN|nr:ABC transporter substrate-binding protein [Acidithrix ferrooxidans]KJF17430.1 D-ribose-binding periplasmic protein precursor [Acidithrix ferrooxidans]
MRINIRKHNWGVRRMMGLASVAALGAIAAACGSTSASTTTTTAAASSSTTAAKAQYTLAYVPGVTGIAFYDSLAAGMKSEATKLGMKFIYQGAAAFSPSAQTPIVNGVCTQKPSVLVVSPTDPVAMAPAINSCLSAGIPVITTDTTLTDASKITSQITTSNAEGGKLAADFIGKAIGGSGQVAILSISATATTQVARAQGFENEIKAAFPNISVVALQYTGQAIADSTTAVNALMLAHPGIKAFFAVSGTGAEGAADAFSANGTTGKVTVVGFDAGPNSVKMLQAGQISALVAQQASQEGVLAAQYAYDKLTGKTSSITATVQLPDVLITTADSKLASFSKYFYKL